MNSNLHDKVLFSTELSVDQGAINRKLLETMVIISSIDGKIGECELESLIQFTCRLEEVFSGDTKPIFKELIATFPPMDIDTKFRLLNENGILFQKVYSAEFIQEFIASFKKIIMADGKVTENEAKAIEILRHSVAQADNPSSVVSKIGKTGEVVHEQASPQQVKQLSDDEKIAVEKMLVQTMAILLTSGGIEYYVDKLQIFGKFFAERKTALHVGVDVNTLYHEAKAKVLPMNKTDMLKQLGKNGVAFREMLSLAEIEALFLSFKEIIEAGGTMDKSFDKFAVKMLKATMFPEDTPTPLESEGPTSVASTRDENVPEGAIPDAHQEESNSESKPTKEGLGRSPSGEDIKEKSSGIEPILAGCFAGCFAVFLFLIWALSVAGNVREYGLSLQALTEPTIIILKLAVAFLMLVVGGFVLTSPLLFVVWVLKKIIPPEILNWEGPQAYSGGENTGMDTPVVKKNSQRDRSGDRQPTTGRAMSKCKYCGTTSFGSCSVSPHRKHEHNTDENQCRYCGTTSYGTCSVSPNGKHEHGSGSKCRFCGSPSFGSCSVSPNGRHEH